MRKKKKIMVVDDDSAHRFMLTKILRQWGFEVSEAENGLIAIEKTQKQIFDLILMDICMPKVSGFEALVEIKLYQPNIPVILMSASATVEYVDEAQKRGAIEFWPKPLDLDDIRNGIDKALG